MKRSLFSALLAPLALVYEGPGACPEQCSEAAAHVARLAGFQVQFVNSEAPLTGILTQASVWIQPGGKSAIVSQTMSAGAKATLRDWIRNGGSYVGFCAGAFFSTTKIRREPLAGLGIFPGLSLLYQGVEDIAVLPLSWRGVTRYVYWEGGPYLQFPEDSKLVEPIAYYPEGLVAAAQASFGKGKVSITGLHPEAPENWFQDSSGRIVLDDPDGRDWDLATEMIRWTTQSSAPQ